MECRITFVQRRARSHGFAKGKIPCAIPSLYFMRSTFCPLKLIKVNIEARSGGGQFLSPLPSTFESFMREWQMTDVYGNRLQIGSRDAAWWERVTSIKVIFGPVASFIRKTGLDWIGVNQTLWKPGHAMISIRSTTCASSLPFNRAFFSGAPSGISLSRERAI